MFEYYFILRDVFLSIDRHLMHARLYQLIIPDPLNMCSFYREKLHFNLNHEEMPVNLVSLDYSLANEVAKG